MSDRAAGDGRLLVLSGPSGVGKGTICQRLVEHPAIGFSVSATTRAPRPGEQEGQAYYFLSREAFEDGVRAGRFLEYAEVVGQGYGTPREPVEAMIGAGGICLLDIDVAGARQVRASGLPTCQIFIEPPDGATLRKRLIGRGSETAEQIEARLALAETELAEKDQYDYCVVNDDLDRAVTEIFTILRLEPPAG